MIRGAGRAAVSFFLKKNFFRSCNSGNLLYIIKSNW